MDSIGGISLQGNGFPVADKTVRFQSIISACLVLAVGVHIAVPCWVLADLATRCTATSSAEPGRASSCRCCPAEPKPSSECPQDHEPEMPDCPLCEGTVVTADVKPVFVDLRSLIPVALGQHGIDSGGANGASEPRESRRELSRHHLKQPSLGVRLVL